MKHYTFAAMDISDQSWIEAYLRSVTPLVEQHGGRFLARTNRIERLEGDRAVPQVVVLIEWSSREALDAFYASEEYRPYLQDRLRGGQNELLLFPSHDVSRLANIRE